MLRCSVTCTCINLEGNRVWMPEREKMALYQNTRTFLKAVSSEKHMSHMGKPTICLGEKTKAQISFAVIAKLISAFVFATRIVQFLFYLNPKFQDSSSFLLLCSLVCVWPVRKPHCWFSHEAAHMCVRFYFAIMALKQSFPH